MANAKLLIVEDEQIVAKDMQHRLKSLGYDVAEVVSSGEAAIQQVAKTEPDLVLIDIKLKGGMDGVAAAEQISARFDVPVVYVTAYADENTVQRAKITEPFGYLLKPFDERDLRRTIELALYKHQMERRVRDSEEWLAATLQSIGDAVMATDARGLIQLMNPAAEALTGWKQDEALGKHLNEVFHIVNEETRCLPEDPVEKVLREETVVGLANHTLLIGRDGTERPILDTAAPIRDKKGRITGIVLVFQDITERRRAEAALRESEMRFRSVVQSATDAIISADSGGNIISWNTAAQSMFGYLEEEVLSKPLTILMPERFREAHQRGLDRICIEAPSRVLGKVIAVHGLRKDGNEFPVELSVGTWESEKGRFFTGIIRDVTEKRRAEEKYRTLFEESKDVVFFSTTDGRILEINPAGLELFGYESKEEMMKIDIADDLYVNPPDREKILRPLVEQGFVKDFEVILKRKDGQKLVALLTATAVRDPAGAIEGYRGIIRDVTEQRQLEQQLLQSQKLEGLGTLVGGIAHDFNNMLTGILGLTQLLQKGDETAEVVSERLRQIEVLSERAADMIRQLLTFSREDVGQKRSLSLRPLVKEIFKLLNRTIPESIEIELRLAPAELVVEADPTQLQQVLMNLAINARDAMPEGGQMRIETVPVELDEKFCRAHPDVRPGHYVRLSVSDTGMGIPPENRSRIFDPFFTTKPVGKGTGLGLGVVYGIVKSYGGAIEVESEVGGGTTFHVYLPLGEKKALEEVAPAVMPRGGTEVVLVVEDEPIVLELGQMALEAFGYRVLTARNGEEGLAVYQEQMDEIALVLMDVVMPRMGGREAFRELKRMNPEVKVLLVSGYGSGSETAEELIEEGICGLLRKPYQIDELAYAVRAALDRP